MRRSPVTVVLCAMAGCGSCEPDRSAPTPGLSSPMTSSRTHVTPPPSSTGARRTAIGCRAIAVDGEVRLQTEDGGTNLRRQDEIEPGRWVWLSPETRLVAKDPRTTRETTFRGLGHAKPCVGLGEESWVTSGTFESTVGSGEAPGAEEWVVTPLGVVRFGAAKLTVDAPVGAERVQVDVTTGAAFVWPAQDASIRGPDGGATPGPSDEGWVRVSAGSATLTRTPRPAPPEGARAAIDACRTAGNSAHDLANALVSGDADGRTAAAQVKARRLARAACAVAAIRVDALYGVGNKENLSESLKDADSLWRSLPAAR